MRASPDRFRLHCKAEELIWLAAVSRSSRIYQSAGFDDHLGIDLDCLCQPACLWPSNIFFLSVSHLLKLLQRAHRKVFETNTRTKLQKLQQIFAEMPDCSFQVSTLSFRCLCQKLLLCAKLPKITFASD